jgi:delta 1-pyrroline-5-carboxylate dehydrogenase
MAQNQLFLRGIQYVTPNIIHKLFMYLVIDPSTGQELGQVAEMTVEDTKKAISAASEAFETWSRTTAKVRAGTALLIDFRHERCNRKGMT